MGEIDDCIGLLDGIKARLEMLLSAGITEMPVYAKAGPAKPGKPFLNDEKAEIAGVGAGAKVVFVDASPAPDPFPAELMDLLNSLMGRMGLGRAAAGLLRARGLDRGAIDGALEKAPAAVIVALGKEAAEALIGSGDLKAVGSRLHRYNATVVMPTHGLEELLKNKALRNDTWKDMQLVIKELEKRR